MRVNLGAAVFAAIMLCVSCIGDAFAKNSPLLSLSMEHFRDTATIADDAPTAKVTISTEKGYVERTGPLRMVWHDEFLTATIDKKTGEKSFQVHEEITYNGNWRYYQGANYQGANGPRSVPAVQISKESANCALGECIYTERIAFPVEEELLRQLAAAHVPAKPVMWNFTAVAKSGPAYAGALSSAEIAGLLLKVDQYTGTPTVVAAGAAGAAGAATPTVRLDLGVGGMAVAATQEQPNRAGILIIAVPRGSVAQKSGIIVGDILYEFDGHPIRQLAELQAAVAACAPNSAVPVKLYRGNDPIALTARF
jgi:PDZ domain-containing protein